MPEDACSFPKIVVSFGGKERTAHEFARLLESSQWLVLTDNIRSQVKTP